MEISGDAIAELVLKEFENWPPKRKPLVRSDGSKEWVPLSGIVAQGLPLNWLAEDLEVNMWVDKQGRLTCLAAAYGSFWLLNSIRADGLSELA
jgi:tRNA-specific adenosine deaminase 1